MCIVFFGCPELTTVSHTGLCLTKKIEWRKQARFNEEPKILLTLILCMWDSMWKKNKIKVITQWGGRYRQTDKETIFVSLPCDCFSKGIQFWKFGECKKNTAASDQGCHQKRWFFSGKEGDGWILTRQTRMKRAFVKLPKSNNFVVQLGVIVSWVEWDSLLQTPYSCQMWAHPWLIFHYS